MVHILNQLKCVLPISNIRNISTTNLYNAQSKVMSKMLGGSSNKRRHRYSDEPVIQTATGFSKGAFEGKKSKNSRRVSVLNKLFMKNITDLMATGEYSDAFLGRGIEISRVQVTPDYKGVNVHWLTRDSNNEEIIDQILQNHAWFLRHELSQLRVMGMVPIIRFVKDKQFNELAELDLRIANADFGEDHEPTQLATKLKTQFQLNLKLDNEIREKIKKLDEETEVDDAYEELPPMPQNVLGLNHSDIMDRVLKSVKKSQALHRLKTEDINVDVEKMQSTTNIDPTLYPNMKLQRQAFAEFLAKRKLLKSKANKEMKNLRLEKEYLEEEEWENRQKQLESKYEFINFIEDNDFIDISDENSEKV